MGDPWKSVPDHLAQRPHPRALVAAACAFTAALMMPLAWHVLHSFHVSQTITESYMAGEELRDALYHANAELILDARSTVLGDAAADPARRAGARAQFRALLDQAEDTAPPEAGLDRADSLQRLMRDTEAAALALAQNGHGDEALALLTAPAYAADHGRFHDALDAYAAARKARVRAAVAAERREELNLVVVAGGILAVSVAVWVQLLRMLERWRRGLLREARERQAAEAELAAALRRLQRLFHHAHDAIYLVDEAHGRIVDANRAARRQTGYTRRQLRRMSLADLDAVPSSRAPWPPPRGSGGLSERQQRRRDGTVFPVEIGVQRIVEPHGALLIYAVRDVTARKALEAQLGKAQKMECVGRLAAGIAHDFGNLLLAISGFALVGRRRLPAGHAAAEALSQIETASAQATGVARSLLHFANRPAGRPRPVELRGVVRSTLELLDPSLPGAIDLDGAGVAGEPLWVEADPHRLQQALLNLCLNARDALVAGGRITVAVAAEGDGAARRARVAVNDNGPGIPEAVQRRLGEPFFTTRAQEGGCGLGLFSVRTVVNECGGRLEIDSRPGAGATFSLVLPLRAAPAEPAPVPAACVAAAERVLLVCRGDVVRGLVADALRSCGFSVSVADDAPGAAERLASQGGCEIAVVDGDLPAGAAGTCLSLVSRASPGAALVLMRGEAPPPPAPRAGTVVARPFTMPELCEAVAAAASARRAAEARA